MKYGVGIDVSKGKSTVVILDEEGEIIAEAFEITHDKEGLEKLEEKMKGIRKEEIKIVMEETGTYHLPVLCYLMEKEYLVKAENALRIKKYLDREIRKKKTDKIDAYKLAEYVCENWRRIEKREESEEKYKELKFLSRQYMSIISVQTKQKVNFSNLCDMLFPGYYELINDNTYELGLEIFREYNHPERVKEKGEEEFIKEVEIKGKKLGHKRAGISLARKIYALAEKTVPSRPNNINTQLCAISCVDTLLTTIKASKTIIAEMDKIARELPEYEEVKELPGCGKKLTSRVIAEIGDIRRYKNAGSIIAYAGLDAPPYQSGKFEANQRHISKRGNKYLRKTGYEIMKAVKSSCKKENEIKKYIEKKEAEGKIKKVAKIAGLNKFLRMYYGIVKKKYKEINIWC